jgi:hypothetical protein
MEAFFSPAKREDISAKARMGDDRFSGAGYSTAEVVTLNGD